jgi:1,4-alpha-glucan branching enzyme
MWKEVFNSDVYDTMPNPQVKGNRGSMHADGPAMHGFGTSALLTIPANSLVVFATS